MRSKLSQFIRDYYATDTFIALHEPSFKGNDEAYVLDALRSTLVSGIGKYVDRFEDDVAGHDAAKELNKEDGT